MPDKCPYCDFEANDVQEEIDHMNAKHPEIIRERLEKAGMPETPMVPDTYEQVTTREWLALQRELRQLRDVREAVHRLNVDWDEVARSCGDPKCNGDCRWVRVLRENGAL
jgi:hypothetical protein